MLLLAGRDGQRRTAVRPHQFADVGLRQGWAVDIGWLAGGGSFGIGESLQWLQTLLGTEVSVGQGGVQREQVGRRC